MSECVKEQDLIMIYSNKLPAAFARVDRIRPDVKKGWWLVDMTVLNVPIRGMSWLVDTDHIHGAEFTLRGVPHRMEVIPPAVWVDQPMNDGNIPITVPIDPIPPKSEPREGSGKVLSMFDRRK